MKKKDRKQEGKIRTPWIVTNDGSKDKPWGFECRRCGAIDKLPARISLSAFITCGKAFVSFHSKCKEAI
jgi:hypothetical protein